jgi:hypothetical protein
MPGAMFEWRNAARISQRRLISVEPQQVRISSFSDQIALRKPEWCLLECPECFEILRKPRGWLVLTLGFDPAEIHRLRLRFGSASFLWRFGQLSHNGVEQVDTPRTGLLFTGLSFGALILNSHSLNSVVAFQTLAGVGTALLVARMLTRYFQMQFLPASLIAVALALEPQQLLFERFVLTESLSALIFATMILWGLEYLFRGRIRHLIFFQITGTLLVAFRVTFAPLILVASISLPFIAVPAWRKACTGTTRRVGIIGQLDFFLWIAPDV